MFIIIAPLLCSILFFIACYGAISMIRDEPAFIIISCIALFAGVMCVWASYSNYEDREFDLHHVTEYQKPMVKLLHRTDDKIIYLIDGNTKEFTELKWTKSDNIYYEIKYYKGRTNKNLVVMNIITNEIYK